MFSKDKEATERRSSGAPSILSAGMQVTGDIVSDGEVQIDGELSGDIHCAKPALWKHKEIRKWFSHEYDLKLFSRMLLIYLW